MHANGYVGVEAGACLAVMGGESSGLLETVKSSVRSDCV